MTDVVVDATEAPAEPTEQEREQIEEVMREVKRGFSLKDRLEKRGLRKVKVTLFLDENVGAEHRETVLAIAALDEAVEAGERTAEEIGAERAALETRRADLEARLRADSLVVSLRAVPPVIAKDTHRRAKVSCGITGKDVPAEKYDDYIRSMNAHLLSVTVESVVDTASGEQNDGLTYEDALDLMDYLPSEQFERLAGALNEVQFREKFSETVEAQEDFS